MLSSWIWKKEQSHIPQHHILKKKKKTARTSIACTYVEAVKQQQASLGDFGRFVTTKLVS